MFRTNLVVHHQEHIIIYCITQFGTIGTIGTMRRAADERADSFETCRADKKLWNKN